MDVTEEMSGQLIGFVGGCAPPKAKARKGLDVPIEAKEKAVMVGSQKADAERRFREIAALLEQARDDIAELIDDRNSPDLIDALERIDAAILKCESDRE